jgi:Kef-type K+ transport system membrane component KefB
MFARHPYALIGPAEQACALEATVSPDAVTAYVIGDVCLILALASLLSAAARRCGQPAVIGQILAGILLGPTLLGKLPGNLTTLLFPHQVLGYLTVLAQLAVVMFMFVVGYEIDFRPLRGCRRSLVLIAPCALAVPMTLGIGCVVLFPGSFRSAGEQPDSRSFLLFVGVATAITALPVLAAIARERSLSGSTSGVVAITSAGLMDVAAWLVLAVAISGSPSAPARPWAETALLVTGWVAIMLIVVRPVLRLWAERPGVTRSAQVPVAIVLTLSSAWVTARLGLHAVFGGFLAGLAMPRLAGQPDGNVLRSMEAAGALLLPLFFAVTGLSLDVTALHGADLALLGLLMAVACTGKLVPAYVTSRLGGLASRESAIVAVLLNTRGLTELIALNVGLTAGLIHQRLFTILVLMALMTTAGTTPALALIDRLTRPAGTQQDQAPLSSSAHAA